MVTFTERQWKSIPSGMKGRITHEYAAPGLRPMYGGARTLRRGRRVLVEGIDFRIERSLI